MLPPFAPAAPVADPAANWTSPPFAPAPSDVPARNDAYAPSAVSLLPAVAANSPP